MLPRSKSLVYRALIFICVGCISSWGFYSWSLWGSAFSPNDLPSYLNDASSSRFVRALEVIRRSRRGEFLVSKAMMLWRFDSIDQLASKFKWGDTSRTDTVLTRHFNPSTGKEEREREIQIFLKKEQTQGDLILDMAHELVHATARPGVDPYDPSLTPGTYIWRAIEGDGGEVEAVFEECQIGLEISAFMPVSMKGSIKGSMKESMKLSMKRCDGYGKNSAGIERERIKQDFYRVGSWRRDLIRKLGHEIRLFPLLSSSSPRMLSSTGHTPYPSSLLSEFQEMTEIACQNSRKRLNASLPVAGNAGNTGSIHPMQSATQQFLLKRCSATP
jgi:hypothetical protein